MRNTASAAVVLFAALALTSCSAPVDAPGPSASPMPAASKPASTQSPAPTTDAATAVPQECIDYVPSTPPDASAVGIAGAAAELPDGVVMNPGIQVVSSTKDPGRVEVVARVCSGGIDRAELIDVGTSIARAIYADPSHGTVTLLMVSSYVPAGEYLDRQPDLDVIQTDYELYLWDAEPSSLERNWR